jgi:hypothetical protein
MKLRLIALRRQRAQTVSGSEIVTVVEFTITAAKSSGALASCGWGDGSIERLSW